MRTVLCVLLLAAPACGEHLATITFQKTGLDQGFAGAGLRFGETGIGVNHWSQIVTTANVGDSWPVPLDWHGLVHDGHTGFNFQLARWDGWEFPLTALLAGSHLPFGYIGFDWLASGVPADYHLTEATITLDMLSITTIPMEPLEQRVSGKLRLDLYGDSFQQPPGDYNQNGEVDAADYVMWRTKFTPPLGPDGDLPNESGQSTGFISTEDYQFWRSQFGHSGLPQGAALGSSSIPEPDTVLLALWWVISRAVHRNVVGRRIRRHRLPPR
jgi:hypothetical protein